uniref:Reverse transcriptase domain-containing protein n=2 Tax=Cuerna arida TaxID=1464854 RepID=A0A1B6EYL5_9HEMI
MYADDTALILANKNKEQLDIDSFIAYNLAKQYCYHNDLVLNDSKTQQLIFTTRPNHFQGLPEINTIESGKYLGLILDQNLSWEPHINQLCHKLNSSLYAVRRMKQISSNQVALTAYYSLFESHLRYGLIVWGSTTIANLQRVLVIQKRAIRTLKELRPLDSCRAAFRELGILTVVNIYIQETILFAIRTGQTRTGDNHPYSTRNRSNFLLNQHHLSLFKKKPSYRGALFFNTLPESLKRLPEKNFKSSLRSWLMERPHYTVREFTQWRTNSPFTNRH